MYQERLEAKTRQCCDRCRTQKIRCTRRHPNESCIRCLRTKVPCIYGTALPKGRPRTNRRPGELMGSTSARPTTLPVGEHDVSVSANPCTVLDGALGVDVAALNNGTSSLPWFNHAWPWDPLWADPIDPAEVFSLTATGEFGAGIESSDAAVTSEGALASAGKTQPCSSDYERRNNGLPKLWPPSIDTVGTCVRQLSDLSTRLYPVYKLCSRIPTLQRKHPGPLITTSAFVTMTIFLEESHDSGPAKDIGCKALYEIFSASQELLNVMHQLQTSTFTLTPAPDSASSSTSDRGSEGDEWTTSTSPSTSLSPTIGDSVKSRDRGESTSPDNVVYYLVLACYTRLLHIYSAFIRALHHDASQDRDSGRTFSLELRLILLSQLISHLLKCLKNANNAYLSNIAQISGMTHTSQNERDASSAGLQSLADVESDVECRLDRLRATLQT